MMISQLRNRWKPLLVGLASATACLGELDEMAKSNARLRRDVDRLKKALKDG